MNRVLVEVQLYKNKRDEIVNACHAIDRPEWIPEKFQEKDIEEIVLGDVPQRDKQRQKYMEEELEKELNNAINNH
ncbi:MAG: hypothetical protein AABX88_00225 [Nanoarchaeota archaeon]